MLGIFNRSKAPKWKKNKTTFSPQVCGNIIPTKSTSIWLAEKSMIEYNPTLDTIITVTQYPSSIVKHCCLKYGGKIYIIDGLNGAIISFDPSSMSFCKKTNIAKLGAYPNAICVFNKILIFNGHQNTTQYLIYDPITNKVIEHQIQPYRVNGAAALLYKNRIIILGGYDWNNQQRLKTFSMSSVIEESKVDDIPDFKIKQNWQLPVSLSQFGHALLNNT